MSTRPKRTRLAVGCHRCRSKSAKRLEDVLLRRGLLLVVRHLKCDILASACKPCREAGVQCDRSTVRFRNGLTLPRESELALRAQQSWPPVHGQVRFHDETPEISGLYVNTAEDGTRQHIPEPASRPVADLATNASELEDAVTPQQYAAPVVSSQPLQDLTVDNESPSSLSTYTTPSPRSRYTSKPTHAFTEREAILLRNFVENMALWADITDPQRSFESEVPARAIKEPVLRHAIFAFSSRHLNRQSKNDATEALQYHNQCVQLLISALSEPEHHITEDLLAAVAILRQHEEMDSEDNHFHLTGTIHILNTVSTFGSSGGLGEAAAWLCLRQDIYVSLTTERPLRTNLQNFHESSIFQRDNDFAWSSRMVFLLAKVLQSAFSNEPAASAMQEQVEGWYASKPHTFEPVRTVPRGSDIDRRFPIIWMLLPVHVIGLQYYHIAKIVLALSERSTKSSTYDNLRQSRSIERNIRHHLLHVLGLAQSNARAENTLFTARHSLVTWGWVLRHRSDQAAAVGLLRDMHMKTGWNMDGLIESLRQQWEEDDAH